MGCHNSTEVITPVRDSVDTKRSSSEYTPQRKSVNLRIDTDDVKTSASASNKKSNVARKQSNKSTTNNSPDEAFHDSPISEMVQRHRCRPDPKHKSPKSISVSLDGSVSKADRGILLCKHRNSYPTDPAYQNRRRQTAQFGLDSPSES
eukprot:Platyproteum_vivax@DN1629_c0_g1_i1.p1